MVCDGLLTSNTRSANGEVAANVNVWGVKVDLGLRHATESSMAPAHFNVPLDRANLLIFLVEHSGRPLDPRLLRFGRSKLKFEQFVVEAPIPRRADTESHRRRCRRTKDEVWSAGEAKHPPEQSL